MSVIRSEPALVVGLVEAVLVLVVAFGLDLTVEQTGAILAVVVAIGAVATRAQVSPAAPRNDGPPPPTSHA